MNLISEVLIKNFSLILTFCLIYFLIFNASASFIGNRMKIIKKKKFLSNKQVYLLGGHYLFLPIFFIILLSNNLFIEGFEENFILTFCIVLIFIFGIIDDNYDLKPSVKTLISFTIFILYFYFKENMTISYINLYFINYKLLPIGSLLFTVLCLYILQNSINFSDGINGVAIVIIISINLILLFYNQDYNYFFNLIFFLNLLFFALILNLNDKFFLGDAGVNILSFLTAINIIFVFKQDNSLLTQEKIFLLLLLPGIDLIRLVFERTYNKISPTKKDVNHFHHLLYKKFGQLRTIIIYPLLILGTFVLTEIVKIKVFIVIILLILIYTLIYRKIII